MAPELCPAALEDTAPEAWAQPALREELSAVEVSGSVTSPHDKEAP